MDQAGRCLVEDQPHSHDIGKTAPVTTLEIIMWYQRPSLEGSNKAELGRSTAL